MGDKLQAKLERLLADNKPYEAQQLAQTIFARLVAQKRADDGRRLLSTTMARLLAMGDAPTASALGVQLCDSLRTDGVALDAALADQLASLAGAFPAGAPPALREAFVDAAVKYSVSTASAPAPLQQKLRCAAASLELASKRYSHAYPHAVRGNNGPLLAAVLRSWASDADTPAQERDLIVARGVLEALLAGFVDAADAAWAQCAPDFGTRSPLLNFVGYALRTVRRPTAGPLFQELQARYAPALARDPAFAPLVQSIGSKYLGLRNASAGAGGGGGLMELMGQMLGGAGGGGGGPAQIQGGQRRVLDIE